MKLYSQSAETFPSRMIAMARSRVMAAHVSPTSLIISTTTPEGPAALPDFILEMAFFSISMVIGIGGPSSVGPSERCSGSHSIQH